jgi:hypothetical protein
VLRSTMPFFCAEIVRLCEAPMLPTISATLTAPRTLMIGFSP